MDGVLPGRRGPSDAAKFLALSSPPRLWSSGIVAPSVISRALVVEVHPSLRGSLTRSLQARLPEVRSCAPGPELASILSGFQPELVFVDAQLLDAAFQDSLRAGASAPESPGAPEPTLVVMTDREPAAGPLDRVHIRKPLTAERLQDAIEAGERLRQRGG